MKNRTMLLLFLFLIIAGLAQVNVDLVLNNQYAGLSSSAFDEIAYIKGL